MPGRLRECIKPLGEIINLYYKKIFYFNIFLVFFIFRVHQYVNIGIFFKKNKIILFLVCKTKRRNQK